jgi:hypothetical protein
LCKKVDMIAEDDSQERLILENLSWYCKDYPQVITSLIRKLQRLYTINNSAVIQRTLRMFRGSVHSLDLTDGYRFVVYKGSPRYIYKKWLYNHNEYKRLFPDFKSK